MTDPLKEQIRIPKEQPFMKNWVEANGIDGGSITNDIKLRLVRAIHPKTGLSFGWKVIIVVKPRVYFDRILLIGGKPAEGLSYYPLKVWPDGIERIPEWERLMKSQPMPEIPVPA